MLSTNAGRDFGAFIRKVETIGYCAAWRVLDAMHFGTPQQRRRLFFIGHRGDWRKCASVLFDPESFQGCFTPAKKTWGKHTGTIKSRFKGQVGETIVVTGDGQPRALTPLEFERLQGFPDHYTLITFNGKRASNTRRYRAIGQSFAVDVVRWIGRRIAACDEMG